MFVIELASKSFDFLFDLSDLSCTCLLAINRLRLFKIAKDKAAANKKKINSISYCIKVHIDGLSNSAALCISGRVIAANIVILF